jgi:predicted transposase/invertase (TIGR01784 family)
VKRALTKEERDYEKWAKSMTRLKGIMDYTSDMESAREKGHEEGREEGREVGRKEGEAIGFIKTARKMKELGLSLNDIAETTGLSLREIEEL